MYTFEEVTYLDAIAFYDLALDQYKLYYVATKMAELKYPSDTKTRSRLKVARTMLEAAGEVLVETYNELIAEYNK